ncbi:hypothetical protein ACIBI4_19635 [Streptomyces sp. NPDC050418]|uniref:hypothetical protein n=1 Tax=Streptomyces sp. NPDC050418 TaxID=3365612 RepID=UPI003799F2B8
MKAAAAVAGTMMAMGAATPALAADHIGELPPMSLNGAVSDALSGGAVDTDPLQATQGVSKDGSVLKPVTDATGALQQVQDAPQTVVGSASQAAPLLGGLQTGSL